MFEEAVWDCSLSAFNEYLQGLSWPLCLSLWMCQCDVNCCSEAHCVWTEAHSELPGYKAEYLILESTHTYYYFLLLLSNKKAHRGPLFEALFVTLLGSVRSFLSYFEGFTFMCDMLLNTSCLFSCLLQVIALVPQ